LPKHLWVVEIHDADLYDPRNPGTASRCGEVVLDASADALHGDGLIFVRVLGHLWPNISSFNSLLLRLGDETLESVALPSNVLGHAMEEPYLE
jgi:hypothetical protein